MGLCMALVSWQLMMQVQDLYMAMNTNDHASVSRGLYVLYFKGSRWRFQYSKRECIEDSDEISNNHCNTPHGYGYTLGFRGFPGFLLALCICPFYLAYTQYLI